MPAVPIDDQELYVRAKEVLAEARPGADLGPLRPLQGGTSSITYRADLALPDGSQEPVVLKVAPAVSTRCGTATCFVRRGAAGPRGHRCPGAAGAGRARRHPT